MERNVVKLINLLAIVVLFILVIFFAINQNQVALIISFAIYIVVSLICSYYMRCPNCGRWPGRNWLFDEYCPRCGEHLE